MRNRLKSGVVLLGALSLIAAACGDDDASTDTTAAAETTAAGGGDTGGGKVGFILPDSASSARWESFDRPLIEAQCAEAGLECVIQNAEGDAANMATIADQLIADGVKVLAIVNLDSDSGAAIQEKAAAAGVKNIDYDRLTLGGKADVYVSFDNVAVGTAQGEGIIECMGGAGAVEGKKIIQLHGSPTDNNATLFKQGYQAAIEGSGIETVGEEAVPDWDNAKGGEIFEQLLTAAGGEIDGVLVANDGLSLAAQAVLADAGLTVPTTGQDATVEGLRAILGGTQCMTVYKPVIEEAKGAVAAAAQLLAGEAVTANAKIDNGNGEIPYVQAQVQPIYFESVATPVADGFVSAEDVCTGLEAKCNEAGIPGYEDAAAAGGDLEGFKGTTPLTPLGDDFKTRLLEVDPALTDFNYAAEGYDLTTIIALAVAKAGDDGIAYASEIQGITRDGEKCTDYATCLAIIDAGGDPDFDGYSGPITLNGVGDPLEASYGVLTMGADNRIDDEQTVYLPAKGADDADVPAVPVEGDRVGDGVLKIGTLLPVTGSLAFLGPPEIAGVDLAILDINAAGGVLGKPVEISKGDSGDTPEFANQTVDRLLSENVDAVIGAAASGISLSVIDKITGAGIVQFSPANTSDKLTTYADKGLYFRVAPPDLLQGAAIAKLVADDGATNVAIIARNDAYGTGLAEVVEKTLTAAGITVSVVKIYEPDAGTFDAEVAEIVGAAPDAVVVIGFEESSKILRTMVENGAGPRDIAVYGCDGNIGNGLGESYDAGK